MEAGKKMEDDAMNEKLLSMGVQSSNGDDCFVMALAIVRPKVNYLQFNDLDCMSVLIWM